MGESGRCGLADWRRRLLLELLFFHPPRKKKGGLVVSMRNPIKDDISQFRCKRRWANLSSRALGKAVREGDRGAREARGEKLPIG